MTEHKKPAEAPKAWRGKPKKPLPPMPKLPPHHGEKAPIRYKPGLTYRIGQGFLDWLRNR